MDRIHESKVIKQNQAKHLLHKGRHPLLIGDELLALKSTGLSMLGVSDYDRSVLLNEPLASQFETDYTFISCENNRKNVFVICMNELIHKTETVSDLSLRFMEVLHAAQECAKKCVLLITEVELLFVILENAQLFIDDEQELNELKDTIELLDTLMRFGNIQCLCTASVAGYKLFLEKQKKKKIFVNLLSPLELVTSSEEDQLMDSLGMQSVSQCSGISVSQ
eukprot:CAMPEP_0182441784 /NCGR_PEP_ID=MMETSP1172-20130603/787_1 /TAXON_ID=708627 /ORGANISM="Timspurckia oligopyrenoides, Strain CCMP3278" /LENGTH=221 /DNA_ID=CAMNT_0024636317 /DNA_START=177 /DNA_END=842 /DNA_ORIENTATION=+